VQWGGAACALQDENKCLQSRFFLVTGVSNLDAYLWVEITLVLSCSQF